MKGRTRRSGVRIYRVVESLEGVSARVLGKQLLRVGRRSGPTTEQTVGARSPAEFRAKLGIVEEECHEAIYWLELLVETGLMPADRLSDLLNEASELLAIVVSSINTSKRNA